MTPPDPNQVHDNPAASRFELVIGSFVAIAMYRLDGDVITFIHTVVPEPLHGRGIASQLVVTALASARSRGLKVIPRCPFFAAYMRAHAETQDLLAPQGRALLGLP